MIPGDENVRTQITLPRALKKEMEDRAALQGISLAGFVREAAQAYLASKEKESVSRQKLSQSFQGSIDLANYPQWHTAQDIREWQREMRKDRQ